MAGINVIAQTAEVAVVTAPVTVMQIVAPANQRLRINSWGISFDGTAATDAPAQVVLMRQTNAGGMLALTPVNKGVGAETVQSTALHTATSEPAAGAVVDSFEVHPQGGYEKIYTPGAEVLVAGGGRLGIQVTAGAAVNVRAKIEFEE